MDERRLIDISRRISEATAIFPGDTVFSRRAVMSMKDGCSCNVSTITMTVHCGTHADAPAHFKDGAAAADGADLGAYFGPCRVVHAKHVDSVRPDDFAHLDLAAEERILFRTPNAPSTDTWRADFAFLSKDAALALAKTPVRLVGIDTQSVDPSTSKTLDAHHALLGGGVAILENLDLSRVPEGRYLLIALPLNIAGADAAPVRAALLPLAGPTEAA